MNKTERYYQQYMSHRHVSRRGLFRAFVPAAINVSSAFRLARWVYWFPIRRGSRDWLLNTPAVMAARRAFRRARREHYSRSRASTPGFVQFLLMPAFTAPGDAIAVWKFAHNGPVLLTNPACRRSMLAAVTAVVSVWSSATVMQ